MPLFWAIFQNFLRQFTPIGLGICLLVISALPVCQAARVLNETPTIKPFVPNSWQSVLTQAVDEEGNVAFDRLKAQPKLINLYMEQLRTTSPDTQPDYFPTVQDKLAYWINAYNALALRLILDRYPVEGLHQIPNLMQDKRYQIGGVPTSLEMIQEKIENDFAAQTTFMPKALFALSINSVDSPPLFWQAYQAATLKQQLDIQSKRFLGNPKYVRLAYSEYGLNPNNTCAILRLSPWFAQVKDGLEKSLNSRPDTTVKVPMGKVFFETVKPYLTPNDMALLTVRCPHTAGFLPPNPILREPSTPPLKTTEPR